jgi:formylglycine-generating enzyme required for sulfatase activity
MRRPQVTDIFGIRDLSVREHTVGDVTFNTVNLPGMDNFQMGNNKWEEGSREDERPRHLRNIAPFALSEYPVTQALWTAVHEQAQAKGIIFNTELLRANPSYFLGTHKPVERISWTRAHEFCRVLNKLLVKPKGHFRLPSEAEWEYAARAGVRKTLYAGSNQLGEVGWNRDNSNKETMPVGLLQPNTIGLYDLSGNIFEWCEDDWHDNYDKHGSDGQAWIDDPDERAVLRVRRGGDWGSYAEGCRCARRSWFRSVDRIRHFGFRLAAPVR